jgi:hypothetical protein
MIIKKKLTTRDQLEFLTHGGREKLSPEAIQAFSAPENSEERRSFLKKMAAASVGVVFTPSILEILSKKLQASDCVAFDPFALSSELPAVIEIHANGGDANIADIAVKGISGDFLGSPTGNPYALHGRPSGEDVWQFSSDNIPKIGGIPFHSTNTAIYRALNDLPADVKSHLAGIVVACPTNSDSEQNKIVGAHFYPLLGRTGTLTDIVGNQGSITGGSYEFAIGPTKPNTSPFFLNNSNGVQAMAGVGNIINELTSERAQKILAATSRMSRASLEEFTGLSLPDQIKALVDCGYLNAQDLPFSFTAADLFPQSGQALTDIQNAFPGASTSAKAAVSHAVLSGFAGFGSIRDNGHDPHNGTAQSAHNARNRTGTVLKEVLTYAALKGKKCMVIVNTDGGMRPADSNNPTFENLANGGVELEWASDNDRATSQFCLYYDPDHTTEEILQNVNNVQIGAYDATGVISSSAITTQVQYLPLVFAYNYLILSGQEEEITKLTGGRLNPFLGADADKYRIFKKIV